MLSTKNLIFLTLVPLLVRADLELDDDVAPACQSVCRPVRQLSQICDVDSDAVPDRLTEDLLTLQCYCLNPSFNVRDITALCASCISQNPLFDDDDDRWDDDRDDFDDFDRNGNRKIRGDALRDVNELMFRCGFPSSAYTPAQATAADRIIVQAARPNNAAQLTTRITAGVGGIPPAATPAPPGSPTTGVRTTTYTSNLGTGMTTGTATILPTAVGAITQTNGVARTGSVEGLVGWQSVLGYTLGVAGLAAFFF